MIKTAKRSIYLRIKLQLTSCFIIFPVLSQPKSFIRADTAGPPHHPMEIVIELFQNCYHLMIKIGARLVSYRVCGILQKYQLILGTG